MVSALMLLVPLAPYALFRAGEPTVGSAAAVPTSETPTLPICCCPLGALAVPDGKGPSPSLPPAALREASRRWKWKNLEAPGWRMISSDRFALRGDVPLEDLRECAACLESFLDAIREALGGPPPESPFSVRVFASARDFRLYATLAGAPNAESFYDPRTAEMVICLDPPRGKQWLHKTLAHELTHVYMDRVWDRREPLWFAEGVAEYFAGFQVRGGKVIAGAVDREALRRLRERGPLPLADFLRLGRDELYGESFPFYYAQAWSLAHYLFSRGDGVIDLLLRGGRLEKIEELEKGWLEHLERMK